MEEKVNNRLSIVVPFYNPGAFLEKCVATLLSQKYDNFKIIFIDDCSSDGSWDLLPHDEANVLCIRNTERKTALENIHYAIMNHCQPDDIVVLVDGDDWLPHKKVLTEINDIYNREGCKVMYGQAAWTDGRRGFARAYDKETFANLRRTPFFVSHIRTFRANLYHEIGEQDPTFSCMKDADGNFYRMTYDVAILFPIMEIAGFENLYFNDTILYIYNRSNPISDDRVNQDLQTQIHHEISKKTPFKCIYG
jgi:glycosyltransferase involved in cell wall biosynthesis